MKLLSLIVVTWLALAVIPQPVYAQPDGQRTEVATGQQSIPFKQNDVVSERTLVKVGIVTVFGVLLALVVLIALKKFLVKFPSGAEEGNRVRLQVAKKLTPKLMLLIVQVDDKEYLIVQSGDRICIKSHQEPGLSKISAAD